MISAVRGRQGADADGEEAGHRAGLGVTAPRRGPPADAMTAWLAFRTHVGKLVRYPTF